MKTEELKKLLGENVTDDQIDAIMKMNGQDIEKVKSDLTTTQTELDGVKKQLGEASKTIEGFKKLDVEGVQKAADDWKAKAEQAQQDAEKQIATLKFDHALDSALTGAKAKNAKAVRALLNVETLKFNDADGSIVGLKEQLETLQKENDYLFESDKETPRVVTGGQSTKLNEDAFTAAMRKGAGLPEPK